jgi:hypothetical protein
MSYEWYSNLTNNSSISQEKYEIHERLVQSNGSLDLNNVNCSIYARRKAYGHAIHVAV